ncbi:MAG TPA: AzlD domain-containing protein [Candidatus Avimonoglobus intestinipullorum]|uniref:AzlD domain-containing protein n=1 Tax=Candidatus Avimonoglobus intestinipullorum TaxID=2840699 RepID=A0A9D1LWD2_9FIRM|nr:AzlD domain-containing protein [Candidatus Avimonoglobus intestinipullorum]
MSYYMKVILLTAAVTYAVRMLPLAVFQKQITSRWVRSFMFYIPYAVLGAMTFPAIFYATGDIKTAAAGLAVAVILAYFNKGLLLTALGASAAVFLCGLIL